MRGFFLLGFLTNEQNTQRVSSAVRGNRTACARHENLTKQRDSLDLLNALVDDSFIAPCMCDKNTVKLNIRCVTDAVGNILLEYGGKFASVFLAHRHSTVAHGNARLELKQIGTKSFNRRASSALM